MIHSILNIHLHRRVPVTVILIVLLILMGIGGCSRIEDRKETSISVSNIPIRWYRQAMVDLGYRITMFSPHNGIAISRGMGKEVRGKAYTFANGAWSPIFDYPYSDYPLIARADSSDLWTVTHLTHEGAYRPILSEFNNGVRKEIPLPKIMWDDVDHVMMKGIHCFNDGTAWMVGQQGHILYFNGSSWKEVESPLIHKERVNVYDGDLNDIAMTSQQTGWAVGRNGIIIRYENGAWKKIVSPTGQTLQKISMADDSTGWAVGNSGTVLRCRKMKWEKEEVDIREQLSSVMVMDGRHAWIVGNNSTLLSFNGTVWIQDETIKQYDDYFSDISVVKDTSGTLHFWIIGNQGIYTTSQSLGFSFTDVTGQSGLRHIGKLGTFLYRHSDRVPDIVVANDGGSSLVYENIGGKFSDITSSTALMNSPKDAVTMAVGDVNNDGETDMLQLIDHRNFKFYLGTSFGGFRDFTARSGLTFSEIAPMAPLSVKFIDLNNDGDLDLYLSNCDLPDQIFLGNGAGTFERVAGNAGISKILEHMSYGAAFGDFNNDGLVDILIPYYVSSKNKFFSLFLNSGGLHFTEVDDSLFYSSSDLSPTGITLADLNNDGNLDVFIHSQKVPPIIWTNDGSGHFTDVSKLSGMTHVNNHPEPINGIVGAGDVNNDGFIDLFDGSTLFLNSKEHRFTEVSERVGIQFTGTPSFEDTDDDGDLDLFIGSARASLGKGDRAALFRNNLDEQTFIKVNLTGAESNRSAVGAKVMLRGSNGTVSSSTVGTGGNQLSSGTQNSLHFGALPGVTYSITALFPSGRSVTVDNVAAGSRLSISESNIFTQILNGTVRSIRRTVSLISGVSLSIFTLFLLVIAFILFIVARSIGAEKILLQRTMIASILVIYFALIHVTVYESETVAYSVTFSGTLLSAIVGLFIVQKIVNKREAQYISHFKILSLLGSGGMGKVYKAVDSGTKKIVALKVLNPELLKDPENRRRLTAEGHLLASFAHPNIVKVFEIGESNERGFIAMEYLEGGTLKEKLEREKELPLSEVKEKVLQICAGLSEVHSKGIVHRDLKTANVMIGADGIARIMDFGLSKSPLVTTMTSLGTVLGTLGYVAPEQVTSLDVDSRTDIFSLGVIMYELLTGQLPFKGENEIALIHSIFNTTPPTPSSLRIGITAEWDSVVMKCLSKDINERYPSADAVSSAVHDL
ncbi:MAG: protein kinase domain-containing protein [Bacteroidota bacterium]